VERPEDSQCVVSSWEAESLPQKRRLLLLTVAWAYSSSPLVVRGLCLLSQSAQRYRWGEDLEKGLEPYGTST
jgi:hypothetical protein